MPIECMMQDLLKNYEKTERPPQEKGNFRKCYYSVLKTCDVKKMLRNPGDTTTVRVNMLIRSMGPISETDMVYGWNSKIFYQPFPWTENSAYIHSVTYRKLSVLFNGLLLPAILERQPSKFQGSETDCKQCDH